jgi:hypothetical protein
MIKILTKAFAGLFVTFALSFSAHAGLVEVFGDINSTSNNTAARNQLLTNLLGSGKKVIESKQNDVQLTSGISTFYSTLSGVTSSVSSAEIGSSMLSGVDLLFLNIGCCSMPSPYSASEWSAMATFLADGGRIGLLDEVCCSATEVADRAQINAMLAALGSSIEYAGWSASSGTATMSSPMGAGVVGYNPTTFAYMTGERQLPR